MRGVTICHISVNVSSIKAKVKVIQLMPRIKTKFVPVLTKPAVSHWPFLHVISNNMCLFYMKLKFKHVLFRSDLYVSSVFLSYEPLQLGILSYMAVFYAECTIVRKKLTTSILYTKKSAIKKIMIFDLSLKNSMEVFIDRVPPSCLEVVLFTVFTSDQTLQQQPP